MYILYCMCSVTAFTTNEQSRAFELNCYERFELERSKILCHTCTVKPLCSSCIQHTPILENSVLRVKGLEATLQESMEDIGLFQKQRCCTMFEKVPGTSIHQEHSRCIVGPGNTSPSVTSHLLHEFNAELKSDVIQRQTIQLCRGDVELKCKLSDLKVALTKTHIQSPEMEFTQSGPNSHNYSIDSDNSNQWFKAQCQRQTDSGVTGVCTYSQLIGRGPKLPNFKFCTMVPGCFLMSAYASAK